MITYSILRRGISIIENKIKEGNYKEAINEVYSLKKEFIDFFENFYNILAKFEKGEMTIELYKILFQVVSELSLDLDSLSTDYYTYINKDQVKQESKLSLLLKRLGLSNEVEWFELANDIMGDIYNFIEYYYEDKASGSKYYLSLEEIKNKVNLLKSKN